MVKNKLYRLASRKVWLINILFWLVVNSVIAYNSFAVRAYLDYPAIYFDLWIKGAPYWITWALFTPYILSLPTKIKLVKTRTNSFMKNNFYVFLLIMTCYWSLVIFLTSIVKYGGFSEEFLLKSFQRVMFGSIEVEVIIYVCILAFGYSISHYKDAQQALISNASLSRQLLAVELESLKSQLNPHFLFNTLNTISSLIRLDNKIAATTALSELSLMLRKVLENQNNQFIEVREELAFINSYLTIQKLRFSDKLSTNINVDPAVLNLTMPFMLLQPLVENAIQYGSQLESNQNTFSLDISFYNKKIVIKLINRIPEFEEHQGFGIGLANTKERLSKIYEHETFLLSQQHLDDNYFETLVTLPVE